VINEIVQFALLGLGVGALYAFGSQGLIVVYRGSGIINFSLGATAIAGVFLQWELQYEYGHPFLVATFFGILLSATLGFLTHWMILRPLRNASSLIRVIATLAVFVTVQAGVVIRYGSEPQQVPSRLPNGRLTLWSDVGITMDRIILLGLGIASSAGLWFLYKSSKFGLATEAVSEDEQAASAVGISPNFVAALNWILSSSRGFQILPDCNDDSVLARHWSNLGRSFYRPTRSWSIASVFGGHCGAGVPWDVAS